MKNNTFRLSRVKRRKSKNNIFKWILLSVLFILLGVSVFAGYTTWKINKFIEKTTEPPIDKPINDNPSAEETKPMEELPFGMLLIGLDYRPETGSMNTDALIISIWNPETKEVNLLSIPRDTRVVVPDYGEMKVNAVYSIGEKEKRKQEEQGLTPTINGPYLLMEVLSDYFDIPVKYYARVDFKGFELIIDELGGVEVYVDRDMLYYSAKDGTNINLHKGLQVLDGKNALDFARFRRSADGNDSSDFERNERQQKILKSLSDKISSIKGFSNIFDILDIAGDHLRTNFSPDEMKAVFWKYKSLRPDNIQTIKMESYWKNPFVYVDDNEVQRVKDELNKAFGDIDYEE